MKQKLLFFMAFLLPCLLFAQSRYSVKGNVIGAEQRSCSGSHCDRYGT